YAYNEYGIPNNLESAPKIIEIRPSDPVDLDVASDGDDEFSDDEVMHGAGQSDGSVDVVVVNPLEVTGHDYEVHFRSQDYYKDGTGTWVIGTPPGAMAAKVVDISGSTCAATGYVGAGQIKLQFDFTFNGGAGNAWCDGFKLTFPDEISIISAGSVDAISARCDAAPTISGQTILWGIEGPPTLWGCIEGNTSFEVIVADFDPSVSPVSIDWIAYDDDYGFYYDVALVHAEGTIEITSLVYETNSITVWDVKDVTASTTVASDQTILGGTDQLTGTTYGGVTDKGWTHFDGIKVKVSGAPPHSTKSYSWDESAGTVSPLYASIETFTDADGNGVYNFAETYSDFGVDGQEDVLEPGFNDAANLDPNGDDYSATNLLGTEGNGAYNSYPTPEPFTDGDADGVWDWGEAYQDVGIDGIASASEPGYAVLNLDPVGDNYDATLNPTGTEGNLTYDVGEPFTDSNMDGSWTDAEEYADANGNNSYDAGYAADAVWFVENSVNTFHNWWGGASTIGGTDYPEVELRFVEMQTFEDANGDGAYGNLEAYTWDTSDPNSGNADMYRTWGAEWTGFNPVPYTAWNMDTEPATQLACVQRDLDNNGQWDGARGGNFNYIWITNVPYDGTSKFDDGDDENDFMHHLITTGEGVPAYYTADLDIPGSANQMARSGILTITPKRDNLPNADIFSFSTAGAVVSTYDAKKINVWPNPYFGYNPEERDPLDQQLHFTNLPTSGACTIRIFDLAGQPVKSLYHTNSTQYEVWDLTNNFGLPVASGMYITHIETDGGNKVLKLGIVQPEQRIDVY
ncbi:MAG: T9SS type A sorting domain-containing protein, partial [Candidatus Marinimicrobia bacterium]|nr:T9SS type A sorting domain-containing protein [Candidatus Neomarinimicrobiota bacterium]